MATKTAAKNSVSTKSSSKKSAKTKLEPATGIILPLAATDDGDLAHAELNSGQCAVWRTGGFRARVRRGVAVWAQEPVASILPTNTLGELAKNTPWNTGQQARLVQAINAERVFEPHFPKTKMRPPSQLLPASTTVLEWEKTVWRHQKPLTDCFPFTD